MLKDLLIVNCPEVVIPLRKASSSALSFGTTRKGPACKPTGAFFLAIGRLETVFIGKSIPQAQSLSRQSLSRRPQIQGPWIPDHVGDDEGLVGDDEGLVGDDGGLIGDDDANARSTA